MQSEAGPRNPLRRQGEKLVLKARCLVRLVRDRWSIRAALFAIALVAILPVLGFEIFLLQRNADSERARAESELVDSAKGIANLVDAEFATVEAALLMLASSPLIDERTLPSFEARLRRAAEDTGHPFVLAAPNGQHLINTSVPPGVPLARGDPNRWAPVFSARRPYVTDVVTGTATRELLAIVVVPIIRKDTVKWTLSVGLSGRDFADVMAAPGIPSHWILSIVDRTGTHLVRSRNSADFAGRPLVPELMAHLAKNESGTLRTTSLEGIPLISTVARAPRSGWMVAIGRPVEELEAPVQQNMRDLVMAGLALLAVALALAWLVARHVDREVASFTRQAQALARGDSVTVPRSALRETRLTAEALTYASNELQARDTAMRELNATLETQVASRTAALVEEMKRREESEDRLRQMQKIEAVGQLTGGIAHDFNNMLAVILGSLHLLERRLKRGDSNPQQFIDAAKQGAERAAALTRRLLAFARRSPLAPEVLDANKLIAGMSDLLRRTIAESVDIETILAGGLWRTHVDRQELENALINLAVNARDAMPEGGKLTIETANTHLDESYAAIAEDVVPGQYVLIAVSDTGPGMPPDVMARAFEPFFTTKTPGEGTGLGLSQVWGFMKQSGGHVKIYSEPGQGASVKLYLPRFFGAQAAVEPRDPEPANIPVAQASELILVVEDDAQVAGVTVQMLGDLGYRTVTADGGATALRLLDAHPEVKLLFTDVVMRDINGRRLADECLRRRPGLKVLFTTGYTRNAVVHNGVLDPGVDLIMKPFSLEALARKVDEVMRRPPSSQER